MPGFIILIIYYSCDITLKLYFFMPSKREGYQRNSKQHHWFCKTLALITTTSLACKKVLQHFKPSCNMWDGYPGSTDSICLNYRSLNKINTESQVSRYKKRIKKKWVEEKPFWLELCCIDTVECCFTSFFLKCSIFCHSCKSNLTSAVPNTRKSLPAVWHN